jgi:hypothetical protein
MKKAMLFLAVAGILLACNTDTKTAGTTETSTTGESPDSASAADLKMPYTATYSSNFKMGDQKIAEKILTLFKTWDDNKLADGKSMFADSISFYANGWEFNGRLDSFMAISQKQRDNYKEIKTVVHAWIPTHSIDKNEDWALVWSTAYTTDTKGKVDSTSYQDTWRMNKDGKFDLMFSHEAKAPASKK